MPTLNWIGKEAVVRHHEDVPFRLLQEVPEGFGVRRYDEASAPPRSDCAVVERIQIALELL